MQCLVSLLKEDEFGFFRFLIKLALDPLLGDDSATVLQRMRREDTEQEFRRRLLSRSTNALRERFYRSANQSRRALFSELSWLENVPEGHCALERLHTLSPFVQAG